MPFKVKCDCGETHVAQDDQIGTEATCDKCRQEFRAIAQLGRYRIERYIGGGGMGCVFYAQHTKLEVERAIKTFHLLGRSSPAEMEKRFLREMKVMARLNHVGICKIHDGDTIDGVTFLAMEYINGTTLDRFVKSRGELSPRVAVELIVRMAEAMAYAHDQGVIHRDLKPNNVMITPQGDPIVMDLGLAKILGGDDSGITGTGQGLGTPGYMAPEQYEPDHDTIDHRCDVYALGVILWELLAGRRLYKGDPVQIMNKVLNGTVEPPGIDLKLDEICLKALAKNPQNRYHSMTVLASDLIAWLSPAPHVIDPGIPSTVVRPSVAIIVPSPGPLELWTSPFTGMPFIRIEPGEFMMGSPDSDKDAAADEKPQHRVRIKKPFYLGQFPVTQGEFEMVTNVKAGYFKDQPRNPVEQVSWEVAVAFCNALSAKEGLPPFYKINGAEVTVPDWSGTGYRLPTEAEWEYSCRAGTKSAFSFGDSLSSNLANFDGNYPYGEAAKGPYLRRTTKVGQYPANAWGLYDMHGNVYEWCWDGYGEDFYRTSSVDDPHGPASAALRVFRGGSWSGDGHFCRAAYRGRRTPASRYDFLGFRLAASSVGRLGQAK